jgi:hypothetical protein
MRITPAGMHKTAAIPRGEAIDDGARTAATLKINPPTEVAVPTPTAISPVPIPNRRGKRRLSRSEGQRPGQLSEHQMNGT